MVVVLVGAEPDRRAGSTVGGCVTSSTGFGRHRWPTCVSGSERIGCRCRQVLDRDVRALTVLALMYASITEMRKRTLRPTFT